MNNPFTIDGYLTTNASINKLVIENIPTDKVNQDIQGETAYDIFSTDLFIKEIKRNYQKLKLNIENIEEKRLPYYLNTCLRSNDDGVRETANKITRIFGERLGVILLTLKKGDNINRIRRKDWNDENWDYWNQLKSVILVGGLASSNIGQIFKQCIEEVFVKANEECYKIILDNDPSNVAIKGCSTYIENGELSKEYLIFDFGQSYVKRSLVHMEKGELRSIEKLDKVLSKYVKWEFDEIQKEKEMTIELNNYFLNIIMKTIDEVKSRNEEVGKYIVISIANYVKNGALANRGGYGKLRLIADDYEKYLSNELYKKYNKKFTVKLLHDGTAMAAAFNSIPNSVCISLGTAFGIGFTIEKNYNS